MTIPAQPDPAAPTGAQPAPPPIPGSRRDPAPGAVPPAPTLTPHWPPGGTPADPWPRVTAGDPAGPRLRLADTGDVLAAIPVLIGFHPEDSLVLVAIGGPERGGRVGLTLRVDLPPPHRVRRVCAEAVSVLSGDGPARAVAVVVRGAPATAATPRRAPRRTRRDVAVAARRALGWAGIAPLAVVWAAGTREGDRWSCYPLPGRECGCSGVVPAPAATPFAAAAVLQGRAVLPDRAAVRTQLEGTAADRERRERLAAAAPLRDRPGPGLLGVALVEAAEGRLTIDDGSAQRFRAALDDPAFRDEALRRCLGPQAPHAEQLWATLTRALPAPWRAAPAALLAVCALLRGDGPLATLAVQRALDDCPGHTLAAVVDTSLRGAMTPGAVSPYAGPGGLRRLLTAMLGTDGPDGPR
ncbi:MULTISPECIES: DUF4192 domain-containing protein [Pseudonocardia]|uniref:DUF4192 domain-containing protein n=2 Tax=Pseudonocardia TaxID=1847 RepID=A0A1Y2MND9_PSEAH|nr:MULTISPECIES: DUF4192 domain-containing protein [Pseudonocardia]OSY36765.1 hypothetical protein BG845_05201 [Pseudonocardia autotrophica]TDN77120.1 uncharacterized protein DUF4192 [Pseudonocardia autotrophica]BBG01125.1 hypothetical protein Pdca_23340 [Pseudonocardia autotrophica]GEC26819.1 hypothetical protein PSA01_38480 [Pseudonocardia saturnea]